MYGQQPGYGRPGMMQPGMGMQPGMMQPGYGQPGMMPGYGQPGMMQPGMRPGMMPGYGQPGMMQPGMGMQPGYGQPGMMQPGYGQAGMAQGGMMPQGQMGGMMPQQKQPGASLMGYNPDKDCADLMKAMKGFGTDEDAIIKIVCNRTNEQRQLIKQHYIQKYSKDLIKQLKSELGGKFEDTVIAMFDTPFELDCKALYNAMHGIGTDEEVLIEILATRPSWRLAQDKIVFAQMYNKDLVKYVESETSGTFRKILVGLLQCARSDNMYPDQGQCRADAEALYKAGEGRLGTNEETFVRIFTTRSQAEMALIASQYQNLSKKSLIQAIDSEFSGNAKKSLMSIALASINPAEFFAKKIYESMKGLGTKDTMLIRLIVSRDEVDMPQIKMCYQQLYNKNMIDAIRSETSGDYKKCLVEIAGH